MLRCCLHALISADTSCTLRSAAGKHKQHCHRQHSSTAHRPQCQLPPARRYQNTLNHRHTSLCAGMRPPSAVSMVRVGSLLSANSAKLRLPPPAMSGVYAAYIRQLEDYQITYVNSGCLSQKGLPLIRLHRAANLWGQHTKDDTCKKGILHCLCRPVAACYVMLRYVTFQTPTGLERQLQRVVVTPGRGGCRIIKYGSHVQGHHFIRHLILKTRKFDLSGPGAGLNLQQCI